MTRASRQLITLALLLAARLAWADEVRLSTGWVRALDVPGVTSASSLEPRVLTVAGVEHDQVVVRGEAPGVTLLLVTVATPQGPREEPWRVVVQRAHTVDTWDHLLTVTALEPQTLRTPRLARVVAGDESLCGARLEGDALVLTPRRPGKTPLLLWLGGLEAKHRRQVLLTVETGNVSRTTDELDAVLTEPLDGRLVLIAGESALVSLPANSRVASADEAVARVLGVRDGQLVVEGRRAGATWLRVWTDGQRPRAQFVVVHAHWPWVDDTEVTVEPYDEVYDPLPLEPQLLRDRSGL